LYESSHDPRRRDRLTRERKKPQDPRSPAERDYDRILYSSALRRLGGVTQVVAANEGHVFHNRLTHSLRVSQLSRRLAQKLAKKEELANAVGGVDPDVAEAAGLAHDLGHPPFGHIAEEALRDCVEDADNLDAFEGNAQSFRIVTKLAMSSPQIPGLNLTRATLNALLKYPWPRQAGGYQKKKYGFYHSEKPYFDFARELQPINGDLRKSAEAEIMDWADDVTYAVHDVEDFYRAGLIPLDKLASLDNDAERRRFFDGMYAQPELKPQMGNEPRAELEKIFENTVRVFDISEPYNGTREHRARLRYFSSTLIGRFVNAIELQIPSASDQPFVKIARRQKLEVRLLKALTWFYVISNPALVSQQDGQKTIVRELFDAFRNAAISRKDHGRNIIPLNARDEILEAADDDEQLARAVADLIARMSEPGLVKLYRRIKGVDLGSVLDYSHRD
jgi:dGTPase